MSWRRKLTLGSAGLILLTLAVFARTVDHDFVAYDDTLYLTENWVVQEGMTWAGVRWAFGSFEHANWHPLTWMSHMLDCEIFGIERPGGHHAVSAVFHAASTVILFLVFAVMTRRASDEASGGKGRKGGGETKAGDGGLWAAGFVAAMFAVHPLHVESVAWAAERKDTLSTLFWMLTLAAYVRWVWRGRTRAGYAVVCVCFAAGLMAKPMLVTLPAVLLLLDYWPLGRLSRDDWKGRVAEKIPLAALSLASCVVTFFAQRQGGAVASVERIDLATRLANAILSYGSYLAETVWPRGLCAIYPHPMHRLFDDPTVSSQLATSALVLVSITALVWLRAKTSPYLVVGWLWYLGTLVPVIGIVQVGGQAMADRYTYVPLVGVFVMVGYGVAEWVRRKPRFARSAVGVGCVSVVACAALAWVQVGYWRNSVVLFERAIAVTDQNGVAQRNLGAVLLELGRGDDALLVYEALVASGLGDAEVYLNVASMRMDAGDLAGSLAAATNAIRVGGDDRRARVLAAEVLARKGDLAGSIEQLRIAARLAPNDADIHTVLGQRQEAAGARRAAIESYRFAVRLDPGHLSAANNLAWLLATADDASIRDGEEAVLLAEMCRSATRSEAFPFLDTLAAAYAEQGDFPNAVAAAEKALALARRAGAEKEASEIETRWRLYSRGERYRAR